MPNEESRLLYEGKYFYEIVDGTDREGIPCKNVYGPYDNIRYASPTSGSSEYKFIQVIDGRPVVAFKENEILVTDRIL